MNPVRNGLLACALLVAFIGCQKKVDTVKIRSIYPSTETRLHAGKKTNFSVEIEYNLMTADSGTVAVIVQEESSEEAINSERRVVRKGKGTIVIEVDAVVPSANVLMVFTPLTVQGSTKTDVVGLRTYEVVKD